LLNAEIYYSHGKVLLEVGRYQEAIESLSRAVEKDPKNKGALFERAKSYF
jgi:tetratricopeptide (TPR) repeat protein